MAYDGEAVKRVFTLVKEPPNPTPPVLDIPTSTLSKCCFDEYIHVFADETNDPFKNDSTTVLQNLNNAITSVTMVLEKFDSGIFTDIATLDNNDYGTLYAYPFAGTSVAYTIDWFKVKSIHGIGVYRVKFDVTPAFGAAFELYSDKYCLKIYNALSVDGTVRLECYMNGEFADYNSKSKRRDFGTSNILFSIRVNGTFGKPKSSKEEEYVKYQGGREYFVQSNQTEEYELQLTPQTPELIRVLQYDFYQQDYILVTDYNKNNHYRYIQTPVRFTGGFEPNWNYQAKKVTIKLAMTDAVSNFERRL